MNLNFDALTEASLVNANTSTFGNFIGTLDGAGQATATFQLPPLPGVQGITLDFAYAQDGHVWDFASDVTSVGITL